MQRNQIKIFTEMCSIVVELERRSKTPNILQSNSNSFLNGNHNVNQQQSMANNSNGYSTSSNGQYQPQLRSKTPTTDRVLFQNTNQNGNQFETLNNTMTNNDYIYLNNTNGNAHSAGGSGVKRPQSQHNKLDTLYSTVNKSTRTPVNLSEECDLFAEKKENIENIAPTSTNIKVIKVGSYFVKDLWCFLFSSSFLFSFYCLV